MNRIRASRTRHDSRRRGAALFIVMMFVVVIAVLSLTAIVTTGNATLVAKSYARENDLRYSAEAALAIGKSRINFDPSAVPDTGFKVLMSDAQLLSADSLPIPGVRVTVYAGPSGSSSGQHGRFASVVAEARDNQGNGFIRRLELTQESFAKYAYWSDKESSGGGTIYFGNGDQLWGPVWSNDVISIASSGATFNDDVATAKTISGAGNGTFRKGYKQQQKPIALPPTNSISAKLLGFATAAGWNFNAPTTGDPSTTRMRIEFVAIDLNQDGDSLDVNEGFFKVYVGANAGWTRGDWAGLNPTASEVLTCGDFHTVAGTTEKKFFPAAVHNTAWFYTMMVNAGMTSGQATSEQTASLSTILQHAGSRCFLGGDPHLAAVGRTAALGFAQGEREIGGDPRTFTPTDQFGAWVRFTPTPNDTVAERRPWDAEYLFPIHRSLHPTAKGVIHITGTAGVSGTLKGKVSLFTTGHLVVLDDLRYASDPGGSQTVCQDMLGLISTRDVVVADNALLTPQQVKTTNPKVTKNLDDTKDLYVQSVVMALSTSFRVEDYDAGPSNVNDCEGVNNGRGCLYLTGGLIQDSRGAVGLLGGAGFVKRYSYDRCAIVNPPPYFPTTGRFTDNRYYELNPVGFNATNLYKSITPDP